MNSKPVNILLAEDDPEDIEFFHETLEESDINANVLSMRDGYKLLNYLSDNNLYIPDIIFLDINMPFINGIECVQKIRNIRKYDLVPVIMISTSSNDGQIEESFMLGANYYVTKEELFRLPSEAMRKVFSNDWRVNLLLTKREEYLYKK